MTSITSWLELFDLQNWNCSLIWASSTTQIWLLLDFMLKLFLLGDNKKSIYLTLLMDRFFIKEKLGEKIIELLKINSEDQLANILNKAVLLYCVFNHI